MGAGGEGRGVGGDEVGEMSRGDGGGGCEGGKIIPKVKIQKQINIPIYVEKDYIYLYIYYNTRAHIISNI